MADDGILPARLGAKGADGTPTAAAPQPDTTGTVLTPNPAEDIHPNDWTIVVDGRVWASCDLYFTKEDVVQPAKAHVSDSPRDPFYSDAAALRGAPVYEHKNDPNVYLVLTYDGAAIAFSPVTVLIDGEREPLTRAFTPEEAAKTPGWTSLPVDPPFLSE